MFKSFRDNRGKFSGQPGQPGQPGQTGANRGKPGHISGANRGKPGQTGANRGKPKKFTRSSPRLKLHFFKNVPLSTLNPLVCSVS